MTAFEDRSERILNEKNIPDYLRPAFVIILAEGWREALDWALAQGVYVNDEDHCTIGKMISCDIIQTELGNIEIKSDDDNG